MHAYCIFRIRHNGPKKCPALVIYFIVCFSMTIHRAIYIWIIFILLYRLRMTYVFTCGHWLFTWYIGYVLKADVESEGVMRKKWLIASGDVMQLYRNCKMRWFSVELLTELATVLSITLCISLIQYSCAHRLHLIIGKPFYHDLPYHSAFLASYPYLHDPLNYASITIHPMEV